MHEAKTLTTDLVLAAMVTLGVNVRRHGHLNLTDLDRGPQNAGVRFVEEVIQAGPYKAASSLYLYGPTGTGKSQMAVSVLRSLLARGVPVRRIVYDRGRAMITQLQDRYTTGRVDEFSERRRKALLWIYEDAGTEKLTPDSFRVLEDIFDSREGNPTIVTTNLSRGEFAKRWESVDGWERFQSRLGPFTPVEFGGADRRLG